MDFPIRIILPDNFLEFIQIGIAMPHDFRFHPCILGHVQPATILKYNLIEFIQEFQQTGSHGKVKSKGILPGNEIILSCLPNTLSTARKEPMPLLLIRWSNQTIFGSKR
jgi:hypothetical protein